MVKIAPQVLEEVPDILSLIDVDALPNEQPKEWASLGLTNIWEKSRDWFNGLHTRDMVKKYLIRKTGELKTSYDNRVKSAQVKNFYRENINTQVALMTNFTVLDNSPEYFNDENAIVNIYNSTLKLWDEKITELFLRDGTVLVGVAFNGLQPYFFHITINSVQSVQYQLKGFSKKLSRLAFVQDITFTDEVVYIDYQLLSDANGENEQLLLLSWQSINGEFTITNAQFIVDADGNPVTEIPICMLSVVDNLQFSHDNFPLPILEDVRAQNEVALNKESELDAVETTLNLPTLLRKWLNRIPRPAPKLFLGSNRVIEHLAGGDVSYVEPSGRGISITSERQDKRIEGLKRSQEKFFSIKADGTEQTATESLLNAAQAKQILEGILIKKEFLYINLFRFWAVFSEPGFSLLNVLGQQNRKGGLSYLSDLLQSVPHPEDVNQTLEAKAEGAITTLETRKRLHRVNFLMDEDLESPTIDVLPEALEDDNGEENTNFGEEDFPPNDEGDEADEADEGDDENSDDDN